MHGLHVVEGCDVAERQAGELRAGLPASKDPAPTAQRPGELHRSQRRRVGPRKGEQAARTGVFETVVVWCEELAQLGNAPSKCYGGAVVLGVGVSAADSANEPQAPKTWIVWFGFILTLKRA